ncbi:PREDICTED: serine palmitoyltransferase 1 [Ceratosolen solmsi marchali]|uniref:Serine palmitoyltransferase 1 n=1 Tax=Ceratosolen solmsi marchali TaxID=326594 RepID=A0AAJ6YE71_9HYME|nr:PREDICTED: serine palmitoyltransferase 1 [Ceratosolen solmsi marchali]
MTTKLIFLESIDILGTIPNYHTLLFVFSIASLIWFFIKKQSQSVNNQATTDECDRKLEEWRPEPLISEIKKDHPSLTPKTITSRVGKRIIVNEYDCLNLGTHNYLNLTESAEIEQEAIRSIQKYGVGSCGPRGFYGTVDVHLRLEERLAQFMKMEEAVVYSYGFTTIASAIAAYCKRKDLVFVDEKVNFAIQKGLDASRSNIKFFKHNDIDHLEQLLKAQSGLHKTNSQGVETTRKFLIVEGIYMNTGTICPLPELVILCRKYKLRIFVDESISFGTLGATGRGITEHFNVPRHEIDMIMGSLEHAIGSVGGFCVGSSFIVEHQRLSGLGYCFSASLPPLLATAAIISLEIMDNKPQIFQILKENCHKFHRGIKEMDIFECPSFAESPVQHLYLKKQLDNEKEKELLEAISDKCIENNLAVIVPVYLNVEREQPRFSIRICISSSLNQNDINFALNILNKCANEVL